MASEPKFFVLEDDVFGPHGAAFFNVDDSRVGDAPRCPSCGGFIGMLQLLPPFRVELEVYGFALGDMVHGAAGDVLASERFEEAFRTENLTGVQSFAPVEVTEVTRGRPGPRIVAVPKYFLMKPCFGRAAVDEARSRIRRAEPLECAECRSPGFDGIYGFKLEADTWQGEDIFRPRGLQSDLLVSERFVQFVKDHGFTNVKLIPTEEFVWDPHRKGPP